LLVRFRNRTLQQRFEAGRQAQKAYGDVVGRKYIQRIQLLQAARSLDEVMSLQGLRCHPLKGDLAGMYAVDLTGFNRLLFSIAEGDVVTVEKVSKHYGD
jgi:proteic killer suppression protein